MQKARHIDIWKEKREEGNVCSEGKRERVEG